jgi:CRP-like cAMP-binding protein
MRDLFTRKLESIGTLGPEARDCLSLLHGEVKHFDGGRDVVTDGGRAKYCSMVLSGLVCRYKVLSAGTRQIMSFHLPGDTPDLQSLFLNTMDHSIAALVPSER